MAPRMRDSHIEVITMRRQDNYSSHRRPEEESRRYLASLRRKVDIANKGNESSEEQRRIQAVSIIQEHDLYFEVPRRNKNDDGEAS